MVVTKVRDGAWVLYSGTPAEVLGALTTDGIVKDHVIDGWTEAGTMYALCRQGA